MSLVCFDTNFVIWGVKRQATSGQEDNIRKVGYLLKQLEKQRAQILVPSIVLAEALAPLPSTQYAAFVQMMERMFVIAPFDSRSAVQFARLWQTRLKDTAFTRAEMKADYQIAAIALANGCNTLYTGDEGSCKFAIPHLPVIRIDDITLPPEQSAFLT